jgi:hypothetical protein
MVGALLLLGAALEAQVPQIVNYQGRVAVGVVNFDGPGQFKFALVNGPGTTTFWSNDGTSVAGSQPTAAVSLTVTKGLYAVLLGDTALTNMTAIPASVFNNSDVRLRVWFNDGATGFQQLSPDQRIASVGYAMTAAGVPSGAITSAMIANGAVGNAQLAIGAVQVGNIAANAVTASEIAAGAVGTVELADGAVGSTQLADTIELGSSSSATGRLDVYRTPVNTPAISLIGSGNQISTFGDDGLEQIRLWGPAYGELLLFDSAAANNLAVKLSANGTGGGDLSLRNSSGIERARLIAATGLGGRLTLSDDAGGASVLLDSAATRQLQITDTQAIARMTSTTSANGSVIELRNDAAGPTNLGAFNFLDLNGAVAGQIRYTGTNEIVFSNNANGRAMTIDSNRNVALSNSFATGSYKLDVDGSIRVRPSANLNNLLITNVGDDINLDLIKDNATPATITPSARIQFNGFVDQATHRGSIHFFTRGVADANAVNRMNIDETGNLIVNGGTASFGNNVTVSNTLTTDTLFVSQGSAFSGSVGIGDTTPDAKLDVQQSSATVAIFNRTTTDGTIVSLQQDSSEVGTISVAGNIVSYNAFTGSHYGWSDEPLELGQLVSMTGKTRRPRHNPAAEPIYGVTLANVANDPRCLGAYLAPQDSAKPMSVENPLLIMAVGNGDMWVVDTGSAIHPGDYLISSNVRGCAMKDDPEKFPIGNIVARAAEAVDWSKIAQRDGVKRARISVLFGNFTRQSGAGELMKTLAAQQREIEALRAERINIHAQLNSVLAEIRQLKARTAKDADRQGTALTASTEADP